MHPRLLTTLTLLACTLPAAAEPSRAVTRTEYLATVTQLRQAVAVCANEAKACDPNTPILKQTLTLTEAGRTTTIRWDWLKATLLAAGKGTPSEHADLMRQADARLSEDATPAKPAPTEQARREADTILTRPEFRSVEHESYLARHFNALVRLINRAFDGVGNLLPHSPWITLALEWGVFALAAAAVLIWVWRLNRRERLAVNPDLAGPAAHWQRQSEDWARRAEAEAARGDWREAVHSLYWSAIVMLEGRRLWRENTARTPREYLALLEPGSPRQTALAHLTRLLERLWYGLRNAAEADYQGARKLVEELRTL